MTDLYKNIGRKFQEERKRQGKSQSEVAESLKMSRASLSNIEQGRHKITLETLIEYSLLLKISPIIMLPNENGKKPHEDYLVQRYCEMLEEVNNDLRSGKRDMNECIDLIQLFGKNLESFKV